MYVRRIQRWMKGLPHRLRMSKPLSPILMTAMATTQSTRTLSPFERLPSEIIILCLFLVISPKNYERGTKDIRELCCISRSLWETIRGEPRFWNHFSVQDIYSIPLQISHLGPQTPLFIYWSSNLLPARWSDFFPPVLALAHRWVSLIIDSGNYSGTFSGTELYAIAPALKHVYICRAPTNDPLRIDYPLSSDNLESLGLRHVNLFNWSPISFLLLKNLALTIDRSWKWIEDILEACPTLETFGLTGDIEPEVPLDEDTPVRYLHLPNLRRFSVKASHPTLPSLIRRIVALNLEHLKIRLRITHPDDRQLNYWASFNPTLKAILSQDDNGLKAKALSVRSTSTSFANIDIYTIEDGTDRFTLEVRSTAYGRGLKLLQTLDAMGPELTVSGPMGLALDLVPYPLNITSLTIEPDVDPRALLCYLASPFEGVNRYPVLRELHLAFSIPKAFGAQYKNRIEREVQRYLRKLWERRGTPANSPIVLDVFNSQGESYYRDWQT